MKDDHSKKPPARQLRRRAAQRPLWVVSHRAGLFISPVTSQANFPGSLRESEAAGRGRVWPRLPDSSSIIWRQPGCVWDFLCGTISAFRETRSVKENPQSLGSSRLGKRRSCSVRGHRELFSQQDGDVS